MSEVTKPERVQPEQLNRKFDRSLRVMRSAMEEYQRLLDRRDSLVAQLHNYEEALGELDIVRQAADYPQFIAYEALGKVLIEMRIDAVARRLKEFTSDTPYPPAGEFLDRKARVTPHPPQSDAATGGVAAVYDHVGAWKKPRTGRVYEVVFDEQGGWLALRGVIRPWKIHTAAPLLSATAGHEPLFTVEFL